MTVTDPMERVLSRLEGVRPQSTDHYKALCPAHPDKNPSLDVARGGEGQVLLHCFASCDTKDVVGTMGLQMSDLFAGDAAPRERQPRNEIRSTYPYTDESGDLLYEVVRFDPKGFRQRRPDGHGGWKWELNGVRRVLYRLPAVLRAVESGESVYIVEGEKDADALARAGLVATTAPQGAANWAKVSDHAADVLQGAEVVVWVDDDESGHRYGRDVVASLDGRASEWRVVRSPDAKDAADYLGRKEEPVVEHDELEVLAASDGDRSWLDADDPIATDDEMVELDEDEPVRHLLVEDLATVAARVDAAPPPRFLARPVWVEDAYGIIGAEDKAGKSWAALDLAVAVAAGRKWLDQYECEVPGPVLLFLGEGSDRKTIRRLRAVCEFHDVRLEDLPIRVCHRSPNLTNAKHLDNIELELSEHPPRLVILDPLYLALGDTKSGILSEMGNVLGALQYKAQSAGAALVIVHHWNQTGAGKDRKRFTGAGAAEWGRVLASVAVDHRGSTDGSDSVVDLSWQFIGDEIPDTTLKISRRIWVDDADDLTSPMHYAIVPPPQGRIVADDYDRDEELREWVLEALADGATLSGNKLVEAVKADGHGVRPVDVRRVARAMASDDGPLRISLGPRSAEMFEMKRSIS